MATKKQRRRRAKEFRHEYVWEDAEGNELAPEELQSRKDGSANAGSAASPSRREPQRPSWRRTLKRGLVFAPIMFVTVSLLSSDLTLAQQVTQTLLIVAIFIPFSYLLDGLFYRTAMKRLARSEQTHGRRGS
jgi:hypothetical protein